MADKTRKITHTYTVYYTEEVTYEETVEAEDRVEAEEKFLDLLAEDKIKPIETNGGQLEITEN